MPWQEVTKMSLKKDFIKTIQSQKCTFTEACSKFGISRKTGYKLYKRFKESGLEGLKEQSRRPRHNPNRTERCLEEQVLAIRERYPTWGGRKIRKVLQDKLGVGNIPAASTITQILKRYGHIEKEESLKRKELTRFEREAPNELWQADFKGKFLLETKEFKHPL